MTKFFRENWSIMFVLMVVAGLTVICSDIVLSQEVAPTLPSDISGAIGALPIPTDYKTLVGAIVGLFIGISFILRGLSDVLYWLAKIFKKENMGGFAKVMYAILATVAKAFGYFGFSVPTWMKPGV